LINVSNSGDSESMSLRVELVGYNGFSVPKSGWGWTFDVASCL